MLRLLPLSLPLLLLLAPRALADGARTFAAKSQTGWTVAPLRRGQPPANTCATADVAHKLNSTGWIFLTVRGHSSGSCSPSDMGYAMGLLEGQATAQSIDDAFANFNASNAYLQNAHLPPVLETYLQTQRAWMDEQVSAHQGSENTTLANYWTQVGALLRQMDGIYDGYRNATAAPQPLSRDQVTILAYSADLEDLASAVPYINGSQHAAPLPGVDGAAKGARTPRERMMDCSALVKLDPQNEGLWTGHTTFNAYWCMLRVFKHYEMPGRGVTSPRISFSARPADLHSKDDFFLLSRGMTVVETSLTVFNKSLYNALRPQTVPVWVRSQVANRLATSSEHWVQLFTMHNSGTHNNEWIVTDYTQFKPGSPLPDGTIWMVDQMVMHLEAADMTPHVRDKHYIASFNVPYFPKIFNVSGYAQHGFNYTTDARSQIFNRDHVKVDSIWTLSALMNANDYQNDPLSKGDPCNQISARCDLASNGYAFGGIDSKNVDHVMVKNQTTRVISGQSHANVPVFSFEPQWDKVAHHGMPITWDFDWLNTSPAVLEP